MIQEKNKGKKKWIVLTIFLILLAVIVFFAVKNLENIKALYKGLTTDTTQIGMLIQQNQKDTVGALSNSGINVSEEDFKKFNEGNLSEEEISEIIFNSMSSGSSQTADNNNQEENADENASAEGSQDADNQTFLRILKILLPSRLILQTTPEQLKTIKQHHPLPEIPVQPDLRKQTLTLQVHRPVLCQRTNTTKRLQIL